MVNCCMQMGTYTKENGQKIKLMVEEYTLMPTELSIMANGKMINNMVEELKRGLMERYTRVSIAMVKRMAKASWCLQMLRYMKVNSR